MDILLDHQLPHFTTLTLDPLDVVRFWRDRGRSFQWIATIGFWFADAPDKRLTGAQLRRWYETEINRKEVARPATHD